MKNYNTIPKKNTEYTFRIPETGNILRCVFEDVLESGRLRFTNLQYNNYFTMTRQRFSFLCAKHKKGEKPYVAKEPETNKKTASAPKAPNKQAHVDSDKASGESKSMSLDELTDDIIKDLNNLSEDEKTSFNAHARKPLDEYIRLLQRSKGSCSSVFDNNDFYGLFAEINDILTSCNVKIG